MSKSIYCCVQHDLVPPSYMQSGAQYLAHPIYKETCVCMDGTERRAKQALPSRLLTVNGYASRCNGVVMIELEEFSKKRQILARNDVIFKRS